MAKNIDMTQGKPFGLLWRFALPLMAGNIFQQMYVLMDTAIVGNGVGVHALASLGAADWINWMILGIAIGFGQGFGIFIAQAYGAKDQNKLNQGVMNAMILALLLALGLALGAHLLVNPLLQLLKTPQDIMHGALTYLRVMFNGLLVVMMYNLFSSILRAYGDSRTPLIAMIVGSVINISLDSLFVYVFHWGIFGAALATVIAQGIAALYCLRFLLKLPYLSLDWKKTQFHPCVALKLLKLGFPVAFQNCIIALGGLVVQGVVNGFGISFIAGYTATNKLYGLLEFAAISYGYAIATFVGQNLGAGKHQRIKEGVKAGTWLALSTSFVVTVFCLVFGKFILGFFVSSDAGNRLEVLNIAYQYLATMAICLSILFILHVLRNALQGLGDTLTPMASGIAELVCRVSIVLTLPQILGGWGIYFSEVGAWIGADLLLFYSLYKHMRYKLD